MAEQLVQLWEIVGATYGGIDKDELRERFTIVKNWRDEECLGAEDAAKAYALGRPRMKEITMPSGGRQWVKADG
jgi:hypothetical protein